MNTANPSYADSVIGKNNDVDLESIDIEQQRKIMEQIEAQMKQTKNTAPVEHDAPKQIQTEKNKEEWFWSQESEANKFESFVDDEVLKKMQKRAMELEKLNANKDLEIQRLEIELNLLRDKLDDRICCEICMSNEKDTALIPCGHVMCQECSANNCYCPFCSVMISNTKLLLL